MDTLFPIRVALAERHAKQLEPLPAVESPKIKLRGIQAKSSSKIQVTPVVTPKIQKRSIIDDVITEETDNDDMITEIFDKEILSSKTFENDKISKKIFEGDEKLKSEDLELVVPAQTSTILELGTKEETDIVPSSPDLIPKIRSRHASHSSRNEAVTTLPQTHGHSHNHNHIHTNGHVNGVDGHAGLALNASSLHRDSLHRQGSTRRNQEKVASVLARLSERSHSTSGSRNSTLTNDHVSVLPDGHANPDLSFSHVIPDPHNPIRRSKSHRNPFSGHLEHRSPSMPTHVSHSNINHEPDLIMTTLPRVPGGSRHSTLSRHNSMGHRIHHSHHNDTEQDYYINENRARYKDDERKQRFNLQTVMLIGCYTMLFVVAIIVGVVLCNQNGWLGFGSHNSESSRSGHISDSTGGGIPILDYPDVIDNRPRINRMPPDTTRVAVAGVGNIPRNPPQKPPANDGRPLRPGNNNGFTNSGSSDFPGQSRPGNNNGFANSGSSDFPGQSRPGNNNGFANSGPSDFDSTNSGKSFDPLRTFDQNVNNFDFDSNNNQVFGNSNLGVDNPIRGNNQDSRNNFGTNNNQANNNQGISLLDLLNNQGTNDNQANTNQGVSLLDLINDSGLGNSFNNPSNANNRGGLPSFGLGSSSDQGSSDLDNSQGGFGSRNNQRNSNNGNSGNSGTSFNDNSGFTGNQANSNNDDLSRGTSNVRGGFVSSKTNDNDNIVGLSNSRSEFRNTGNNAGTGAGIIRSSQSRNNQGQLDNFGVRNSEGSSAVRNNQNNRNTNIPGNENRNNQGNQNRNNQGNQNQNNQGIKNMNNQGNQNRNNQGSFGNNGQGQNQVNSNNNQMGFDITDSRNNNSPTENQSSFGNVGSNGNTRNQAQSNGNIGNQAQGNGNTGNLDLENINLNIDAGFVKSQGVSNAQNPFGTTGRRNIQGTPSTSLNQNDQLKSVNTNSFNQNGNRNSGSNFQRVQGGNSQSSSRTPARNNFLGSNPNQGSAISNINRQSSGGTRQTNQGFTSNNGVPATNPENSVSNNNRQNVGQNPQIRQNSNQPNRGTNRDMISKIRSNLPGPIHPPGSKGENWNSRPSGNTGENWNSNKGSQLQHSGSVRQGAGRSLKNSNGNINAGPVSNVESPSSKPKSHNRIMAPGDGTINHSRIIGELLTQPNIFGGGISVQHGNLMSQSTVSMIDGDVIPAILRPTPDIIVHINPDSIGAGVTLKSTKSITERTTPRSVTRVQNNRQNQATSNSNSQKNIFVNRNQNSRPGNIGIPFPSQNQNSRPTLQSTSRTTPRPSSGSIGIPIPFINQRTPLQNQVKSISQATSHVRGTSGNIGIPLPSQNQVQSIAQNTSPVRGTSQNTGIPRPSQNQVQSIAQDTSPVRGTSQNTGIPRPSQNQVQSIVQDTSPVRGTLQNTGIPRPSQNQVQSIAQGTSPVRGTSQNTGIPRPSQNQNSATGVNQPNSRTQPIQNRKVVRTWTHTDTEGTYSQGQVRSDGSFLFTNCKPVGSCIS